ncbi:MAG: GNAT family N-acetyltransferase [Myxococcales bacterium]|nr:GNAT family N-acetyltransferase [Myxococcales bacterium]
MDLQLGGVRQSDIAALARMSRDLIEVGLPWTWRRQRLVRALLRDDHVGAVLRGEAGIVGFCVMQLSIPAGSDAAGHAHLVLLAVDPAARRRGAGSRLVRWAEQTALVGGVRHVSLETRASSETARAFYRALGYREIRRVERYYSGREAAVVMGRELLGDAEINRARVRADALVADAITRALDDRRRGWATARE